MIIWIASYPKSGNTWVRSFLTNYLNKNGSNFNFHLLDQIKKFPRRELIDDLNINYYKFEEIVKNWINMQELINLKQKFTYLKTHNAMCTVNNYPFTNKKNTIGFIYIVRDPRDVILSYSYYLKKNVEFTLELMIDKSTRQQFDEGNDETILGSWSENYKSWRDYNAVKKIIIKYEDLIQNPYENFFKIINYLNGINGLPIDKGMIKKSIENTSFKKLQNLEKKFGFHEKRHGVFFRNGKSKNWENELDKKIVFQIEQSFKEEMLELGYL